MNAAAVIALASEDDIEDDIDGVDSKGDHKKGKIPFRRRDCAVVLARAPSPSAGAAFGRTATTADLGYSSPLEAAGCAGSDVDSAKPPRSLLAPLSRGPVPLTHGAPSCCLHILHKSSGLVCAMTGFAADVWHLVRVLAREVSDHEFLYADSPPPTIHELARDTLALATRNAAFASSGRPLGVQALMVGNHASSRKAFGGTSLQIYMVDPTGGWRHWGRRGDSGGTQC